MTTLYHEVILDHYKNPRNNTPIINPNIANRGFNPMCGDSVLITGLVDDHILKEICCISSGCVISAAATSLITEQLCGRSITEIIAINPSYIVSLLNLELGPTRLRCALLGLEAIKKALLDYNQRYNENAK